MSTRSLNKVMLIGNLTRDPELRYTPNGTAVCSFGLATNRSWIPSDSSERREEAEFHRIVAWNKLAELCAQLLSKGRKVYIEGRLQTRSWESPSGEKRQGTDIVAEDMVILDSKRTEAKETEVKMEVEEGQEPSQVEKEPELVEEKEPAQDLELEKEEKETKKDKKVKDTQEADIDVEDIPF